MNRFAIPLALALLAPALLVPGAPAHAAESVYTSAATEKGCEKNGTPTPEDEDMGNVSLKCAGYKDYSFWFNAYDNRESTYFGHLSKPILEGAGALREHDVVRVTAYNPTGDAEHVSDVPAIDALRDALAAAGVSASVIGGARSHFTELNRERHRLPAGLEGIVFSITPLFHSRGTEQLVESLAMQRLVAQQAVGYAAGLPVHVGPVTLRPRFNNVATKPGIGGSRNRRHARSTRKTTSGSQLS